MPVRNLNTMNSVATTEHNTRASACFDHKNSLCYSSPCLKRHGLGLPVHPAARAAKDEIAAFCFVAPFMAAQTGRRKPRQFLLRRVPGIPTCLGCRPDWNRGWQLSQLHPTEANMAASLTSSHDDLLVSITPRAYTRFYGTSAQLVAEGLIPDGFEWPHRVNRVSFELGQFTHRMGRSRPEGIKGPMSIWATGDYWFLQRSLKSQLGSGFALAQLYEKKMELAALIRRNSPEWERLFSRAWAARSDDKYQAFRRQFMGEPKRGRGRPAKAATAPTQRATS